MTWRLISVMDAQFLGRGSNRLHSRAGLSAARVTLDACGFACVAVADMDCAVASSAVEAEESWPTIPFTWVSNCATSVERSVARRAFAAASSVCCSSTRLASCAFRLNMSSARLSAPISSRLLVPVTSIVSSPPASCSPMPLSVEARGRVTLTMVM